MAKIFQKNKDNLELSAKAREKWWVDYTDNFGARRRVSIGTEKEAENVLKTVEVDRIRGLLNITDDKSNVLVSTLIDEYLEERKQDSTNLNSFWPHEWLKKELGHMKLGKLTKSFILKKRKEWLKRPGNKNLNQIRKEYENEGKHN